MRNPQPEETGPRVLVDPDYTHEVEDHQQRVTTGNYSSQCNTVPQTMRNPQPEETDMHKHNIHPEEQKDQRTSTNTLQTDQIMSQMRNKKRDIPEHNPYKGTSVLGNKDCPPPNEGNYGSRYNDGLQTIWKPPPEKNGLLEVVRKIDNKSAMQRFPENIDEIFLRKLMALDGRARNGYLTQYDEELEDVMNCKIQDVGSVHPLDLLCNILSYSCNDNISQQEIVSKMAMCQFAVPLMLPAGDGTNYIFMLWAMRDIIKRWRPQSLADSKGFREDSLVNIPMPFFSFVRLGKCNLSKSKILNQVLSPDQQMWNYFIHREMEVGNATRKCSEGLVEISWYFPSGQVGLDIFREPLAAINLRGDLEEYNKELDFLMRMSSAVFIFVENINEKQYHLLSALQHDGTGCFLVFNANDRKPTEETQSLLQQLLSSQTVKKQNIIIKNRNTNDSQVAMKLKTAINKLCNSPSKSVKLTQITDEQFSIDENNKDCREAKLKVDEIIQGLYNNNITHYKTQTMKLQGDLWKQLTKTEKELCRMRELGDRDAEEYKSKLQAEIIKIRKQQSRQSMSKDIETFITAITNTSSIQKKLFLKWLKIRLDTIGRRDLSELKTEYRKIYNSLSVNACELKTIDQRIADSSLGIEHFLRELGQLYEAEHFTKNREEDTSEQKFSKLPRIAAELLLDGFSLELIDGDASNIPLLWITDVLKELDIKTGGRRRMRVITVLGVQSTGKSTLLNTMFGLQFPVASGRCTRGAFMTLLKVKETFQEEMGCHFVLVIDTEGLKSLELASLEGSYEHDNELATVAIGLSDITIVNMAMENTEEMKDVLQIVVHAFLRMKEIGKKPNCLFVHQNVCDVSAHVKNRTARQKFLEQLDKLTKLAAKMEKRSDISAFSDIITCDLEKDSWYIPGLWHGIPPMASVNSGYSENIRKLKLSIIETLQSMPRKPQNIREFTEWIKSLWNAVKHEKFVFSFRNQLVTESYNQLCIQYSDWEWRFQKNIHHWMIKTETFIYNLAHDKLDDSWKSLKAEMFHLLDREERTMTQSLEDYFEGDYYNAHLLEMFRGDFMRSVKYIRKELEYVLLDKCEKTFCIQKEKCKIHAIQERYIDIMQEKVANIMDAVRKTRRRLSSEELKSEFEWIWRETLAKLPPSKLEKYNIDHILIQHLKQGMKWADASINNKLRHLTSLDEYRQKNFKICSKSSYEIINRIASSIIKECHDYVTECVSTEGNFNEMFPKELLKMINKKLNNHNVRSHQTTVLFELDLKLHILAHASIKFQKMHNDFVHRNDPRHCLEMLKAEYVYTFQSIYEKRNQCQRIAEQFCMMCLKPAIIDHIQKYLGKEIVEDILQSSGPQEYKSRTLFQSLVLEHLIKEMSFQKYVVYINNYESFVKTWISKYIQGRYNDRTDLIELQLNILRTLTKKLKRALTRAYSHQVRDISDFLGIFCNILQKELVISKNNLKVVTFQSNVDITEFANDVRTYIFELQEQVTMKIKSTSVKSVAVNLMLQPLEELVKKVIGCGKQCPFCKAPCEAGGAGHKEHFVSVHRPRGLGGHKDEETKTLDHSICSTNVISNKCFSNADTEWKPHPYKDYHTYYPNWAIHPDPSADASDYWKFIFKEFNGSFAKWYTAEAANPPEDWYRLTKDHAISSLKTIFKA